MQESGVLSKKRRLAEWIGIPKSARNNAKPVGFREILNVDSLRLRSQALDELWMNICRRLRFLKCHFHFLPASIVPVVISSLSVLMILFSSLLFPLCLSISFPSYISFLFLPFSLLFFSLQDIITCVLLYIRNFIP